MRPATKLNREQQFFVIQSLACFASLDETIKLVKENYGIEISKQGVNYYDPNTLAGKQMPEDLKQLFHDTRREYLADITTVGVANQKVRLEKLNRHINTLEAKANPNIVLISELLKQAAKEAGGMYTAKNYQPFTTIHIEEHEDASISDIERSEQLSRLITNDVSATEEEAR